MNSFPPEDQFTHTKSPYERPTLKYRCGRADLWGKPCNKGPSAGGICQGMAECNPIKGSDDRWVCRRPSGACEQGPLPDGTCCNTQPPCSPVPSIRLMRGRIVLFSLVIAIALLSALIVASELNSRASQSASLEPTTPTQSQLESSAVSKEAESVENTETDLQEPDSGSLVEGSAVNMSDFSILNPGELSDIHSAFVGQDGCSACHVPENEAKLETGLFSGFRLSSLQNHKSLSQGCVSCHTFDGPAATPHNLSDSSSTVECQACHNEHNGRFAELTEISNQQCASCHQQDFSSFKDHPQFAKNFPYDAPGSVVFDHSKHFKFHFDKAKNKDAVPQSCTSCHKTEGATYRVEVGGYESSCSGCHESNISASAKAELPLLSLPALKLKSDEGLAAYEACGAKLGKRFKGAGKSRSNPFTDWLLGYRLKKTDDYAAAYCNLLVEMESKGLNALIKKFEDRSDIEVEGLFNGLTPELVSTLTAKWINDERYRPDKKKAPKGVKPSAWFVTNKGELNYRPVGHGDKTALAWLDFAHQLRQSESNDKLAKRFANSILKNNGGLGACMKCHLPSYQVNASNVADEDQSKFTLWSKPQQRNHHRFKFNHSAHLRFVGAGNLSLSDNGVGCGLCHALNPESGYADSVNNEKGNVEYESNFFSLKTETCSQCHNEQSVKDDCTLCHVYHESPGFTPKLNRSLGGKL